MLLLSGWLVATLEQPVNLLLQNTGLFREREVLRYQGLSLDHTRGEESARLNIRIIIR
jgi:hypothetical protein